MNLHVIGIDLGKTVFHAVGLSHAGEVAARKKFSRTQLLRFTLLFLALATKRRCAFRKIGELWVYHLNHRCQFMPFGLCGSRVEQC